MKGRSVSRKKEKKEEKEVQITQALVKTHKSKSPGL